MLSCLEYQVAACIAHVCALYCTSVLRLEARLLSKSAIDVAQSWQCGNKISLNFGSFKTCLLSKSLTTCHLQHSGVAATSSEALSSTKVLKGAPCFMRRETAMTCSMGCMARLKSKRYPDYRTLKAMRNSSNLSSSQAGVFLQTVAVTCTSQSSKVSGRVSKQGLLKDLPNCPLTQLQWAWKVARQGIQALFCTQQHAKPTSVYEGNTLSSGCFCHALNKCHINIDFAMFISQCEPQVTLKAM
eukprot:5153113-Amphidinium_carterae.1